LTSAWCEGDDQEEEQKDIWNLRFEIGEGGEAVAEGFPAFENDFFVAEVVEE
jgi:hypothetical protein